MTDFLSHIQQLQFHDKPEAESLLLPFIEQTFNLSIRSIELRPLAVSLNSFNGFLSLTDGRRLFFKTHSEPDNIIQEYYNATQLAQAGYPIIQPIYSSTESGKQLLIYDVVESPSVFDVAWQIETGKSPELLPILRQAQENADDQLFQLYRRTLAEQSADQAEKSPVHQLFYHRLTGGRLQRFYPDDLLLSLPNGASYPIATVKQWQWVINGRPYSLNLGQLIERAIMLLNPAQAGWSVVGHGDAHNGNVFLDTQTQPASLIYFDPAFAGRHHPLLDLTKPLFHNVFAMWMYYPREKHAQTPITWALRGNQIIVEHDYALHAVRDVFLTSKVERVLKPLLRALQEGGGLRKDWRDYLKASLLCCPLLTMNLADRQKFSPEIGLLGLSMAVEMGAESAKHDSLLDSILFALE